jgi:hypothetical protein
MTVDFVLQTQDHKPLKKKLLTGEMNENKREEPVNAMRFDVWPEEFV